MGVILKGAFTDAGLTGLVAPISDNRRTVFRVNLRMFAFSITHRLVVFVSNRSVWGM